MFSSNVWYVFTIFKYFYKQSYHILQKKNIALLQNAIYLDIRKNCLFSFLFICFNYFLKPITVYHTLLMLNYA
jgi:hypothetical protein